MQLMARVLTVRLDSDLSAWLTSLAAKSGISKSDLIRDLLERAKTEERNRAFLRLAGSVRGPKSLSRRKGFSRR